MVESMKMYKQFVQNGRVDEIIQLMDLYGVYKTVESMKVYKRIVQNGRVDESVHLRHLYGGVQNGRVDESVQNGLCKTVELTTLYTCDHPCSWTYD
jgi:hypothetical protein